MNHQANPKVSVVILTKDSQRFIVECIESVPRSKSELEIVVVDGGSRDDTVRIVQESRPDARICVMPGSSIPQARNRGLAESRGEYVLFLDSDERLVGQGFEVALDLISTNHPAFVAADYQVIDETGHVLEVIPALNPSERGALFRNPVGTLSIVCRRDLLTSLGGFCEEFDLGEDYDLWLRLGEVASGCVLHAFIGQHRRHPGSVTQTLPFRSRMMGLKATLRAARRRKAGYVTTLAVVCYLAVNIAASIPLGGRTVRFIEKIRGQAE